MKRSTACVLALGIIVFLATLNAGFLFHQPYYEFWDAAANSLSILRAKHFAQIYGPYSRWQFYHPGAGYFYVDALGEWVFHDLLHVVPTPYNGQILIHLCLTTGLFVAGLKAFTDFLPAGRRWVFVCAALILAVLHFGSTGRLPSWVDFLGGPTAFLSNWSAHFLVLPFFCLLTAGAAIAAGRGQNLPLLVLAGGFLVHAHVAQPLFVVPVAVLAYAGLMVNAIRRQREADAVNPPPGGGGVFRSLTAAWRESRRAHLWAGGVLAVFLLPIVIDAFRGHESNLAAIVRHLRAQAPHHKKFARSVAYFLQFLAYAPYQMRVDFWRYDLPGFLSYLRAHLLFYVGWLVVLGLVIQAPVDYFRAVVRRRSQIVPEPVLPTSALATDDPSETRRFLAIAAGFAALVLALTLYWGTRQEGDMYYYNSWFNFGLLYFALLVAAAVLCTRRFASPDRLGLAVGLRATGWRKFGVSALGAGAVVLTVYLGVGLLRIGDNYGANGNQELHATIQRAIAYSNAAHPGACKVVTMPVPAWVAGVAVVLELARAHESFVVPSSWEVTYGKNHGWNSRRKQHPNEPLCPWYVVMLDTGAPPVSPGAPVFLLGHGPAALVLTPPAVGLSLPGDTAEINFAPSGDVGRYLLDGWSGQEPGGRWSYQSWGVLCFRPSEVKGTSVEMAMTLLPFVAPLAAGDVHRQRMSVSFNGEPLGPVQELRGGGVVNFTIPAARWNAAAAGTDPLATLSFGFPDAVSPASLDPTGRNADTRQLGVHFFNIQMRVAP